MERLLFDDIPYLKAAQEEHDVFSSVLRDNGVKVVYYVEEVAKAISTLELQLQLVNEFLDMSNFTSLGMREHMTEFLMRMTPAEMVTKLIAGIKKNEIPNEDVSSLLNLIHEDYPYISDPMPNLYFTRDPGACIGNGISIHNMHTREKKGISSHKVHI